MASSDHHAYGNAHGAYRPHQSQYDGPTTTQPPPPHNAVYDPTTYHNRSPQKQQPMDAAYRSYAPDEQRYRASSIRDAEKKAEQHAAYLQQLEQTKRQQQQLEQQRERQVRDEADVFGPSHGHARPRGRGAYTTANVVAVVPEANPKPSIATLADASPSPAQKRAQQAAYAKSIADAAASDGPHAARHLVHRPRMPANETFMHENNLFSALSQEEAEDSAKGRKRAQQAEYARMLQAQQRAKEHEPPDRGLDAHVRAPVSGKARPGANDDDDAYYDLGGAGTGMIANIGAASGGTSPSRHTQPPPVVSYPPHQQPAAPSSSSSKQPWQAHGGNAPPYQQRPSDPRHPHEYGDPGPGGDDEYYPQYNSGQRGPHDDNRGPPQQAQQPRQPGGAPRGGREQEAAAAAEQKREQQRRYYEEIAHAAAAPPIRRERAPLHRAKTPHGRADVESWEGTGTGFQVGEPVRYPGGGVPARTPAEVEQAESRARKQALQRTYAKQLAADAVAPVLPADRVYTGRSRAAAAEEDVDTNPYSGYDPWRSARHGSDDPKDASSSIGRATGIFEPMTAQEIAERAAATKKASHAEYYQQLQEFEEQKARTAAAVARTPRTSLYRLQQQQKDAEVQNLTAATRYKGESPLTRRAQRGGHESDGGGGGGGGGYVYGDGDGDMDGVGGYPLPYDDRGSSGRSRSRRAPDPVDAQAAAWRRQQQRQYHEALEADARAAPTPATYTPQRKPWHERAARDGDDEAEQNAYSPHLHPSYHSNSKRPGPGTPYNKRRTDRDGDGDGDAGGRRDGYDGEVRRDGHGHGQQPQYQPPQQPQQQQEPQQQPHRLDMAVPGNYGYGQGNGYNHGQNQSQSQSQSHTYGYGNAAAGGGDGALPSYRSGAATPRAQGYPGGGGTGTGTGTGTTTPGTGSATGTTTPSAAYGRTQLFNAAGGPSVGAPSRGVTDAPGPSTVAAVYPSGSSYTYGARGPSYQPYAATPAGHPTPSRGLMGAALPASRGRSSGGGKSSISF